MTKALKIIFCEKYNKHQRSQRWREKKKSPTLGINYNVVNYKSEVKGHNPKTFIKSVKQLSFLSLEIFFFYKIKKKIWTAFSLPLTN